MDATLGVVQRLVQGGSDGWELVLDGLADEPDALLERLRDLGAVVGAMHAVLASDMNDPAFAPEEASEEALSLMTATIDEQIERLFVDLPARRRAAGVDRGPRRGGARPAAARLAPRRRRPADPPPRRPAPRPDAAGAGTVGADRGCCSTSRASRRARCASAAASARRCATSPGCCARSPTSPSRRELQRGDRRSPRLGASAAREAFLEGYLAAVEPTLLPPSAAATQTLLSIFELEKAVYELRYELDHRPDWVPIPVAAIVRLLEEPIA